MEKREDWPLGPALKAARERADISVRKAATKTKGLVSSGRWYQLESGVQKVKGRDVPIGTTAETVIAAALAVGWEPTEALKVAGLTAPEAVVQEIEAKIFTDTAGPDTYEPQWLLYLEALLEYVENHPEFSLRFVNTVLLEAGTIATRAIENVPTLADGIDWSISYSERLNELLIQLRDEQQKYLERKADQNELETTTQSGTPGEADQSQEAALTDDSQVSTTLDPAVEAARLAADRAEGLKDDRKRRQL